MSRATPGGLGGGGINRPQRIGVPDPLTDGVVPSRFGQGYVGAPGPSPVQRGVQALLGTASSAAGLLRQQAAAERARSEREAAEAEALAERTANLQRGEGAETASLLLPELLDEAAQANEGPLAIGADDSPSEVAAAVARQRAAELFETEAQREGFVRAVAPRLSQALIQNRNRRAVESAEASVRSYTAAALTGGNGDAVAAIDEAASTIGPDAANAVADSVLRAAADAGDMTRFNEVVGRVESRDPAYAAAMQRRLDDTVAANLENEYFSLVAAGESPEILAGFLDDAGAFMDPRRLASLRDGIARDVAAIQEQEARLGYAAEAVESLVSGRGLPEPSPTTLATGAIIDPSEGIDPDDLALAVSDRIAREYPDATPGQIVGLTANALRVDGLTNPEWRSTLSSVSTIDANDFDDGNIPERMTRALDLWGQLAGTPEYANTHVDDDSREMLELGLFARNQGVPDRQIALAWQKMRRGELPPPLRSKTIDNIVSASGAENAYDVRAWAVNTARMAQAIGGDNAKNVEKYVRERMEKAFVSSQRGPRGIRQRLVALKPGKQFGSDTLTYVEGMTEYQIEGIRDVRDNLVKRYHEQIAEQGASPSDVVLYRWPGSGPAFELRDSKSGLPIDGVPLIPPGSFDEILTTQQRERIREAMFRVLAKANARGVVQAGASALNDAQAVLDAYEPRRTRTPQRQLEDRGL